MLIRCPKCETGFRLPVDRIPAKGAKLRCSACTHAFRVRLDDAGEVEVFDPNEEPVGGTQIGHAVDEDAGASTQFGLPARSKSAEAGYDPFPLAKKAQDGNSTQMLGSGLSEADDDDDDEIELELLDDDVELVADQTQIGPTFSSSDADYNDRTQLDPVGRTYSQAGRDLDDSDENVGSTTQAWQGGAIDLFEGENFAPADASGDLSDDFDPFGDAFSEPVSADELGLLMPSTPLTGDQMLSEASAPSSPSLQRSDSSAPMGMSEEAFLLGGKESEFGPASEMVDPNFGSDVAVFDPTQGVVGGARSAPKPAGRGSGRGRQNGRSHEPIELMDTSGPTPQVQSAPMSARPAVDKRSSARGAKAPGEKRQAPARVHSVRPAGPSAVRKAFDSLLIFLVVLIAFLAFTASRTGGFLDFANFGHMLEVAYEGEEYVPREEWARVVEAEPATPAPEEPLRLENVHGFETKIGKSTVLIVTGKVRNYGNKPHRSVKLHGALTDAEGKVVEEQTVPVGRLLERSKISKVKSVDDLEGLVEEKVSDVGKEGTVPFTIIFTEVPAKGGSLDYRIALAGSES